MWFQLSIYPRHSQAAVV